WWRRGGRRCRRAGTRRRAWPPGRRRRSAPSGSARWWGRRAVRPRPRRRREGYAPSTPSASWGVGHADGLGPQAGEGGDGDLPIERLAVEEPRPGEVLHHAAERAGGDMGVERRVGPSLRLKAGQAPLGSFHEQPADAAPQIPELVVEGRHLVEHGENRGVALPGEEEPPVGRVDGGQ